MQTLGVSQRRQGDVMACGWSSRSIPPSQSYSDMIACALIQGSRRSTRDGCAVDVQREPCIRTGVCTETEDICTRGCGWANQQTTPKHRHGNGTRECETTGSCHTFQETIDLHPSLLKPSRRKAKGLEPVLLKAFPEGCAIMFADTHSLCDELANQRPKNPSLSWTTSIRTVGDGPRFSLVDQERALGLAYSLNVPRHHAESFAREPKTS